MTHQPADLTLTEVDSHAGGGCACGEHDEQLPELDARVIPHAIRPVRSSERWGPSSPARAWCSSRRTTRCRCWPSWPLVRVTPWRSAICSVARRPGGCACTASADLSVRSRDRSSGMKLA
jgi:hypothetical protein